MDPMWRPLLLSLALIGVQTPQISLELRVFDGSEDVTAEANVTVYDAGQRDKAMATFTPGQKLTLMVPAGFYDAQAMRVRDGRLMNVTWRERLVVMAYPDEAGRHLEIVNFKSGFGALQVRPAQGMGVPDVALYAAGARDKEVLPPVAGDGYALFVVPGGKYDLLVRGAKAMWHQGIEIPAEGTRMWVVQ